MPNIYIDNSTEETVEELADELGSEMADVPKAKILREAISLLEEQVENGEY